MECGEICKGKHRYARENKKKVSGVWLYNKKIRALALLCAGIVCAAAVALFVRGEALRQRKDSEGAAVYSAKIPVISLQGSFPLQKKRQMTCARFAFAYAGEERAYYAWTELQGMSSNLFPKKSYRLRFVTDTDKTKRRTATFNGLLADGAADTEYYLKANYADRTLARNVVAAKLWSEMAASREGLDRHLAALPYHGALTGFPVLLSVNGAYQGVYTLNMAKTPKNLGMDGLAGKYAGYGAEGGEQDSFCAAVRNVSDYEDMSYAGHIALDTDDWYTICASDTSQEGKRRIEDSLTELFQFVKNADDEAYAKGLSAYIDIPAAVDYLLLLYYLEANDNSNKNVVLITYDGKKWIHSAYDLDTTFGMTWNGEDVLPINYLLPSADGESSGTGKLFWDRFLTAYADKLRERYIALRETLFTEEKLLSAFDEFAETIPAEAWAREDALWEGLPPEGLTQRDQLRAFLKYRTMLLDAYFGFDAGGTKLTGEMERGQRAEVSDGETADTASQGITAGTYAELADTLDEAYRSEFAAQEKEERQSSALMRLLTRASLYGAPLAFALCFAGLFFAYLYAARRQKGHGR